ncbi:predicted protein [Verticillium alfalfae VaMs.102]|uniref:Predicted protein n=1 Tax=Verticillium alfalfae (strain VaMs.102 / ATCC MYA-4576 / FGSC 10136) TaxID=526221 RepID=C9SS90_VERA1|nr:predicted protein [Verticillium alfalfae VaMs.102]EEY21655.1 predicted protein [Verticillium alfalfae VaMs.102]
MAPGNLSSLLVETLRTRDVVETLSVVRALVNSPSADEAIAAMRGIPRTTVSEILRCLDPLEAGHRLDCTHSLVIPDHLQEFSPVALAFDEFGVRKIYKDLFTTMVAFVELLHQAGHQLMLADYVVLLRCAGATSDVTAAKRVWKLMDLNEVWDLREGLGYDELVKARYLVEPLYRQYDLARVRLRPRNLRKVNRPDMALRGRLEKLRLYEARSKYHAYGKSPHQPERDLHWVLSLPGPLNRIWFKMLNQGVTITESLQCSYLVACGRWKDEARHHSRQPKRPHHGRSQIPPRTPLDTNTAAAERPCPFAGGGRLRLAREEARRVLRAAVQARHSRSDLVRPAQPHIHHLDAPRTSRMGPVRIQHGRQEQGRPS